MNDGFDPRYRPLQAVSLQKVALDQFSVQRLQDHAPERPSYQKTGFEAFLRELFRHLVSNEAGGPCYKNSFHKLFSCHEFLIMIVIIRRDIASAC
jgi:hypothetical protein